MLVDESDIEHTRRAFPLCFVVCSDNALADANDRSGVAPDFQLIIIAAYARASSNHLNGTLRIREALKPPLAKRIERHDGLPAFGDSLQLVQHARRVGRRVMAKEKDAVGLVEV